MNYGSFSDSWELPMIHGRFPWFMGIHGRAPMNARASVEQWWWMLNGLSGRKLLNTYKKINVVVLPKNWGTRSNVCPAYSMNFIYLCLPIVYERNHFPRNHFRYGWVNFILFKLLWKLNKNPVNYFLNRLLPVPTLGRFTVPVPELGEFVPVVALLSNSWLVPNWGHLKLKRNENDVE